MTAHVYASGQGYSPGRPQTPYDLFAAMAFPPAAQDGTFWQSTVRTTRTPASAPISPKSAAPPATPFPSSGCPSHSSHMSKCGNDEAVDEVHSSDASPWHTQRKLSMTHRPLTPLEARHLTLLLVQHLSPLKGDKCLMAGSIDLAEKLHDAGIRWDRYRRVMGMHLRGIWEECGGGSSRRGVVVEAMHLYVQGSFLTVAEEPHPLDVTPLPIPLEPSSYAPLPKLTLQAGLLNALPVYMDVPIVQPVCLTDHTGDELHAQQHGRDRGHDSGESEEKSPLLAVPPHDQGQTEPSSASPRPEVPHNTSCAAIDRRSFVGRPLLNVSALRPTRTRLDPSQRASDGPLVIRPGFQLFSDLGRGKREIQRDRRRAKWNERKERLGLMIRVEARTITGYSATSASLHSARHTGPLTVHPRSALCLSSRSALSAHTPRRRYKRKRTFLGLSLPSYVYTLGAPRTRGKAQLDPNGADTVQTIERSPGQLWRLRSEIA